MPWRHRYSRIGLVVVAVALGGVAAWRHSAYATLVGQLEREAARAGYGVRLESVRRGWLRATVGRARMNLGGGISLVSDDVQLRGLAFGRSSLRAGRTSLFIRGAPDAAMQVWAKTTGQLGTAVDLGAVDLEYDHVPFGRVQLTGVELAQVGPGYRLAARQVVWGPRRWSDVVLWLARPHTAVTIGIGPTADEASRCELTYFPTRGGAAEWVLHVAYQKVAPLIARFGMDATSVPVAAQVSAALSIIVPDGVALPIRGSLQVVTDGWLRPDWPDAAALVGKSNSIGARIRIPRDLSSVELERVEVGAGVFALVGSGAIAGGPKFATEGGRSRDPFLRATRRIASAIDSPPPRGCVPGFTNHHG